MLKKVFLDLEQTLQKDIPIFQFVADCALRISLGYSINRLKLNVGRCYKKFWILWYHFLFLSFQSVAILVIPTQLNAKNIFWDNFPVFPTHNAQFITFIRLSQKIWPIIKWNRCFEVFNPLQFLETFCNKK